MTHDAVPWPTRSLTNDKANKPLLSNPIGWNVRENKPTPFFRRLRLSRERRFMRIVGVAQDARVGLCEGQIRNAFLFYCTLYMLVAIVGFEEWNIKYKKFILKNYFSIINRAH